jgi:hypothetical protein
MMLGILHACVMVLCCVPVVGLMGVRGSFTVLICGLIQVLFYFI